MIGGFGAGSVRRADVLVGDLANDGTVIRWTPATSLPMPLAYHGGVVF